MDNEAIKTRDAFIENYTMLINELTEKRRYLENIKDEDVSICGVCGEVYNRKSGVVCCVSCFRDRYL